MCTDYFLSVTQKTRIRGKNPKKPGTKKALGFYSVLVSPVLNASTAAAAPAGKHAPGIERQREEAGNGESAADNKRGGQGAVHAREQPRGWWGGLRGARLRVVLLLLDAV